MIGLAQAEAKRLLVLQELLELEQLLVDSLDPLQELEEAPPERAGESELSQEVQWFAKLGSQLAELQELLPLLHHGLPWIQRLCCLSLEESWRRLHQSC